MTVVELLTLPEVAAQLRVSLRTVQRLVRDGRIRVVRVRRRPLVTSRELAAFIAHLEGRRVA